MLHHFDFIYWLIRQIAHRRFHRSSNQQFILDGGCPRTLIQFGELIMKGEKMDEQSYPNLSIYARKRG
jgi:hypothetical protein